MLLSLAGSVIGLVGAFIPELMKMSQDKRDKSHELEILKLQMQQQAQGSSERLSEITVNQQYTEALAVQQSYRAEIKYSGKFAASVRPAVTYMLVLMYIAVKMVLLVASVQTSMNPTLPWQDGVALWQALAASIPLVWGQEDMALLFSVVSFWFGGRMIEKKR